MNGRNKGRKNYKKYKIKIKLFRELESKESNLLPKSKKR